MPSVQVAKTSPPDSAAVGSHVEGADVARPVGDVGHARVRDVQAPLVGREGQAVGAHEVVGRDRARAGARVDAVDVGGADLTLGREPLVVAVDPVRRVGEPDRAVGAHDDVVGAVQALAVEAVGDRRDRAVVLGALDAPGAVRAAHQPSLAVDGVAVGVARRRAEDADVAGGLVPAQDAVVGDVAPHQVAAGREVGRALGPAGALEELLDARARAHEAPEALVEDLVLVRSQGCGPPQTSSRKTISVASERRGPSLRMRV